MRPNIWPKARAKLSFQPGKPGTQSRPRPEPSEALCTLNGALSPSLARAYSLFRRLGSGQLKKCPKKPLRLRFVGRVLRSSLSATISTNTAKLVQATNAPSDNWVVSSVVRSICFDLTLPAEAQPAQTDASNLMG